MSSHVLSRGTVFAGRYQVERCIGSGGMGAVYEALHLDTERRVALKVMLPQALENEGTRERFKQEARVAGKLRHPHIVDVLDAGVDEETDMPYLVMELLSGETLGARIDRLGALPAEETLELLYQAASALDRLHERSIVHRDLKPENLFLTWADDGVPTVKLLDFGIAKVIADGMTSAFTEDAQGTPVYMAPEQFAEQIRISPATDIYALGMLSFALLTGTHYWGAEIKRGLNVFMLARIAEGGPREPASVRAQAFGVELSPAFDAWFATITALVPGERYPMASVAIEALGDALGLPLPSEAMPNSRQLAAPPSAAIPARSARDATALSSPEPLPAKPSGGSGSTPPIPLQRPYPFWRRPTLMTVGLAGFVGTLVLITAFSARTPPPSGSASASAGGSSSAAASLPSRPFVSPSPSSAALPGDVVPSVLSSSPPVADAGLADPAATTASLAPSVAPAAVSGWRAPVPRASANAKRPKYTRE